MVWNSGNAGQRSALADPSRRHSLAPSDVQTRSGKLVGMVPLRFDKRIVIDPWASWLPEPRLPGFTAWLEDRPPRAGGESSGLPDDAGALIAMGRACAK